MTTKAKNTNRSRSGNSGGSARTAASVTTPRIPAHDEMVISRQPIGSATYCLRRCSRSSMVATGKIHRNRTTMTTSVITSPCWSNSQNVMTTLSATARICSPTNANAEPVSSSSTISHVVPVANRVCEDWVSP